MAAKEWSSFFAELFRDWLMWAETSGEAFEGHGVPDDETVSKVCQDDTEKLRRPSLVVSCEEQESDSQRLFIGRVEVKLRIQCQEDGNEPTEAAGWIAAVRAWVRNDAAWAAFIQTLDLERRTDWRMMKRLTGVIERDRDEENHTMDITLPVTIRVMV